MKFYLLGGILHFTLSNFNVGFLTKSHDSNYLESGVWLEWWGGTVTKKITEGKKKKKEKMMLDLNASQNSDGPVTVRVKFITFFNNKL